MKDELGKRIKRYYEDAYRIQLPRRTYVVIRVDGKNFHTFTKNLPRPYYRPLADALDEAAVALCKEMMGCRFAYGQSDEYSFLLTDFETEKSAMWFDGNVQKMASVAASLFTAHFTKLFFKQEHPAETPSIAAFDARVMAIPDRDEVAKYFLWRQLDASANSLNMLASSLYPHEELLGKTATEKHELIHAQGRNWNNEAADFKRGRLVRRTGDEWTTERDLPVFQRQPDYLDSLIPAR